MNLTLRVEGRFRRLGLVRLLLRVAALLGSLRIARLAVGLLRWEYRIEGGCWRPGEGSWSIEVIEGRGK